MQEYELTQQQPEFPELLGCEYLIDWLGSCGFAAYGFNGAEPITWAELQAWRDMTKKAISGWEAEVMHQLSIEYCSQLQKSRDPACLAPYQDTSIDALAERQKRISSILKGL